jgi:small conductance mechanosensitive channel
MEAILNELIHQASLFFPKAAVSLLVFFSFWFANILIQKVMRRIGEKAHLSKDLLVLMGRTASSALIIFGAITALGTAGIDVSALVAGLGLTGFALGFALRDALSNLLAGVLILIYRPFQRNDRISVAGFEGIVIQTDLRYTTLQGEDKKILIPNSTLFTNSISLLNAKK